MPAALEDVFRFFCTPANLLKLTPPSAHAKIVSLSLAPVPGQDGEFAGPGSIIRLQFRVIPFLKYELGWTAQIVELEWLKFFRDIQTAGPFRRFEHRHSFRFEERNGRPGTVIRDEVNYELGILGPLGSLAARPALWRMFRYRHQATERALASR